jgi:bifunctional UDP-N-acetylglucosamine pyrophosphorylase/glucosamine-1-phosphate N-acetyltransferase
LVKDIAVSLIASEASSADADENKPAVEVVMMAAGKGTRMKSDKPKVLQMLAHWPLAGHALEAARSVNARKVVVVTGHGAAQVESALALLAGSLPLEFVRQEPQLGTGHAVQTAAPHLADDAIVLVLSGDVPLTHAATLQALLQLSAGRHLALLTVNLPDPTGYGRIVRHGPAVSAIVEHKDASEAQRSIQEIYGGILAAPARQLKHWLSRLNNHNAQGEYYLTDVVKLAVQDGVQVLAHRIEDPLEVAGVNSPAQLAELERAYQLRLAHALMEQGVRLKDPARMDVRGSLVCARDVEIDVGCVFEGQVQLGQEVRVGPHCVLANCQIEAGTIIQAFTHIDGEGQGVHVGAGARIGPFARLRPGADLGADVHIGNFVEVKNARLAKGAKANHLAYLGDASVGERVNFGAGSITANYDGAYKHHTVIEEDVHVGSNCVLIAPVTLGAGGTIGGGSTISKDTPAGALTVARGKQVSVANWKRPAKGAKK